MVVIVPMRWLAGNTHLLEHRKWGEADMCIAVDLVYNAFLEVEKWEDDASRVFYNEHLQATLQKAT